MNRRATRAAASGYRALWTALATCAVLLLSGLVPQLAHARGPKTVPDIRKPRTPKVMQRAQTIEIGVTVHVASADGMPIAWGHEIRGWVERANEALAPHGLSVRIERVVPLSGYGAVTRRRQRRQLARKATHDGTIHVFVTGTLDNRRTSTRRRRVRGLHWRYHGLRRQLRQREYVMVTLDAPQTTFAHEVGHLMGLRHSNSESNIMCSCRRSDDTWFSDEQGAVMREGARRFRTRQANARARAQQQRDRNVDRTRRRRW